ncbi:MAG: type II toxin-antitoxin system RelE/ParE family toxin [Imperialibacter sp.]|uniref:type II toxin-antitoxin system RelE/ParE family toxin n=1 Tax=Imperialibacter sp. TaxID=2038411 RepID=UPI0032EB1885
MPEKEYIAYKGLEFQIEWYYSPKGESQALDYYLKLAADDRQNVLKLFRMMGEIGAIRDKTKFRFEGDKVYAFKPQPHRFLSFFVEGRKIIVTNAFWKKQQKLPPGEKDRALRCMNSYKTRVKEGTYYEKEK